MPTVTDILIHQAKPAIEIAFDTGQIFKLPWKVQSLQVIDNKTVGFQFEDGRQTQYNWQQLYDEVKKN